MSITQAFGVCDVTMALCGYPSTDYAARTIVTHLYDYGFSRFEMGYASAIAVVLFLMMILCNKAIQSMLRRVGTWYEQKAEERNIGKRGISQEADQKEKAEPFHLGRFFPVYVLNR